MQIGIIGCGKMGQALIGGVLNKGLSTAECVTAFDPVPAAFEAIASAHPGVQQGAPQSMGSCDVILVCVKPQYVAEVLKDLSTLPQPLIISIAAGIPLSMMEAVLPEHRIVRVMPNTPALVGSGASAFALGSKATQDDAERVTQLLSAVGIVEEVPEALIDSVTGLSGSGPAYIFTVIEALADGGVLVGLPRDKALQLAAQTVLGAARMVLETGTHPAALRDMVTSPGGTTIAGLAKLEEGRLRNTLIEAVKAATARARELGETPS